jgi:hypothetical protein
MDTGGLTLLQSNYRKQQNSYFSCGTTSDSRSNYYVGAVRIATRLRAGRPGVEIPVLRNVQISLHLMGAGGPFPKREGNRSTPSSAEVKNGWSCTSSSSIWLHGVDT